MAYDSKGPNSEDPLTRALWRLRIGDHRGAEQILEPLRARLPKEISCRAPKQRDIHALRVATLLAELDDHYDRYKEASAILDLYERDVIDDLKRKWRTKKFKPKFGSRDDPRWQFFRQQLYFAWQRSIVQYRAGEVPESRELLNIAIGFAEAMDPPPRALRTQLYYGAGKVSLHESNLNGAIKWYRKAITSASARYQAVLEAKLADREYNDHEMEAAQYSIAKTLALGLGHCFREQGRLEEAHTVVVAGQLLLGKSPDTDLTYYAVLLRGSIERGAAGEKNHELLRSAATTLKSCAKHFKARRGDVGFRWRYEHALLLMQQNDLAGAEREINEMLKRATPDPDHKKWIADGHIALSRIYRRQGKYRDAVTAANTAVKHAGSRRDIERRARTVLVDALYAQAKSEGDRSLFDTIENELAAVMKLVSDDDARNRAGLQLLRARVTNAKGHNDAAQRIYDEYLRMRPFPEVGRNRELAAEVEMELATGRKSLLCPADGPEKNFNLKANKKAVEKYVFEKAYDSGLSKEELMEALGIENSKYFELKAELLEARAESAKH
jgi:Tetratricopeptide repeat